LTVASKGSGMYAAWYEKNGPAAEVMKVGELSDPQPGTGEVRIRLHASAVNPSDVKAHLAVERGAKIGHVMLTID
jgi:NADPH2:quinone reductase